jgi:hypothetical protein
MQSKPSILAELTLGSLALGVFMTAPASATPGNGVIEAANCTSIAGWVCDKGGAANTATSVDFWENGAGVGAHYTGTATTAGRADADPYCGTNTGGVHSLSWPIPEALKDNKQHTLFVYEVDAQGATAIGTPTIGPCAPPPSPNAAPTGLLEVADGTHIAGYAMDPNFSGPIMVHIYVDGQMTQRMMANADRGPAIGVHGFDWHHEPFGAGKHDVIVYAIGVDATGAVDNINAALTNSPTSFNVGCLGLKGTISGGEFEWCTHYPAYWVDRQRNSQFVSNENVRILMDSSLGGTITQLYAGDWTHNLVMQHGGSAVQLSFYGNEAKGPRAYFYRNQPGECDPTPYTTEQACKAAHPGSPSLPVCVMEGDSLGAHVADCVNVKPCGFPDAGAAFNPIQAQGPSCSWNNPISATVTNNFTTWNGSLSKFNNYSKTSAFPGMTLNQTVQLGDVYAQVTYDITYNGPYRMTPGPAEIPAFFTASGVSDHLYYYNGPSGYTNSNSPMTRVQIDGQPDFGFGLPGMARPNLEAPLPAFNATESWWTLCDAADQRCVTLAAFDPIYQGGGASLGSDPATKPLKYGYMTPFGSLAFYPGEHIKFSLFIFPYKPDAVIGGKSIRQRIFELKQSYVPPIATPVPVLDSPLVITQYAGVPFSYQITAKNSPGYYLADNLPAGLTYDFATHTINGKIDAPGLYTPDLSAANGSGVDWQYLRINVQPKPPAPTAIAQSVSTTVNLSKSITLTGTDPSSLTLSYTVTSNPSHGTLNGSAPNLSYTPSSGFTGSDSFAFKVNNGAVDSAVATVSISVGNPPAPTANAQSVSTAFNTAKSITLTGSDPSSLVLSYTVTVSPSHGTLSGTAPTLTYTPTSGYTGPDNFSFKVNNGFLNSTAATVSITVNSPAAPTATAQSVATVFNTQMAITLTGSDPINLPLTYSVTANTAHGTLSGTAPNLTYTPTSGYSGSDSFSFKVRNGFVDSPVALIMITVNSPTVPSANGQPVTTNFNTPKSITLTGSDPINRSLTYTVTANPAHGTLSGAAPNLTYTPTSGYVGSDSFNFKVNNGDVDSMVASVLITISAPGCIATNACAANTCTGSPCQDSCGNSYPGTKICTTPPPTGGGDPSTPPTVLPIDPTILSSLDHRTFSLGDEIVIPYNGPATSFNWQLNPQNGAGVSHARSLTAPGTGSVIPTATPHLSLSTLSMNPGSYQLGFQVINGTAVSDWATASISLASAELVGVRVFPNPCRINRGDDSIAFDTLPANSQVKLFTVAGHWIKTLDAPSGSASWDLTNDSGERVASGIYLYHIKSPNGKKTGQVHIVK